MSAEERERFIKEEKVICVPTIPISFTYLEEPSFIEGKGRMNLKKKVSPAQVSSTTPFVQVTDFPHRKKGLLFREAEPKWPYTQ